MNKYTTAVVSMQSASVLVSADQHCRDHNRLAKTGINDNALMATEAEATPPLQHQ
jgi:hypothetical protein